tara:strand:+ start:31 stop:408 length:378 start_codon:yes stop_codon:yes gene_type:complete
MKKLLILLFSLLISFNSYGEWIEVGKTYSGNSYYLDFDLIKSHQGYIYYWQLEDLIEPDSTNTLSTKSYFKGNCVLNSHMNLTTSFYKQPMGRGNSWHESESQEWEYLHPESIGMGVLNIACNYL